MISAQVAAVRDAKQDDLLSFLACPSCNLPGQLHAAADSLECIQCRTSFPVIASGGATIPWMFPDPAATRLEWQARFRGFLHLNSLEQTRLSRALEDGGLSKPKQRRIEALLAARVSQRAQIIELLDPLGFDPADVGGDGPNPADHLASKVPKHQGLMSYHANIFRDWSWNNGENETQLKVLEGVMQADKRERLGNTLTLGAGAGRLAYDIHRNHYVDKSVAVDINPALLLMASRVIHGETVPLYEFPVAPLNSNCFAVLQDCHAPQSIEEYGQNTFFLVFADAMNPPFEAGSFDTVVTPWLIDVIPQDMREFIPRINQLLPHGGVWLNTGSLAFFHQDERMRYSEDELLALVESCGFEILAANRNAIPYLQAPSSGHGRVENVLSFSARKVCNAPVPPRFEYLPTWLRDSSAPIPNMTELVLASSHHLLQAQVFAAIDGERTVEDIGRLLAQQYGLLTAETVVAVKHILVEAYESLEGYSENAGRPVGTTPS